MDPQTRHITDLVQLCQRVAAAHVESIHSLGDELSFRLVKPILERCNADQLLRLEESSPHLQKDTPQIWKDFCYEKYPLQMERYSDEPESWKERYFFLYEEEARRVEEAGTKLRNQRLEAEERKKEREVKITDRLPPPKRQRTGWLTNSQPKTLFQKTRTEASKLQKNMYQARMIPPMPTNGKTFRVLPKPPGTTLPLLPPTNDAGRVTVNTVVHRRLSAASHPLSNSTSASSSLHTTLPPDNRNQPPISRTPPIPTSSPRKSTTCSSNNQSPTRPVVPSVPIEPRPLKPSISTKKDPMASLFVPKRKAYSQRPS